MMIGKKEMDRCDFLFSNQMIFLLLKWYFKRLLLLRKQPPVDLEAASIKSNHPPTYVFSPREDTKSLPCRDYEEADTSDKSKNKVSDYIHALCL